MKRGLSEMVERRIPDIRFEGYTDAWEQRKLGELGTFKNGMNFDKNAMGHGHPFVNLQDIFDKSIVKKEWLSLAEATPNQLKDYNLLEGDVLFVRSSVKREGVGLTAIIPENFINTTYSGFIIRFRSTKELSKEYKQFIFSIPSLRNQILVRSTVGANTNINQDNLKLLTIPIPNLKEQTKIGNFFKQLDNTITLQERKLELLKEQKKGFLQKMFPKEGSQFPEIRFPGFTDAWEQRKLGEVSDIIGGGTPNTSNPEFWDGDIDWYAPAEIGQKIFVNNSIKKITELGLEKSSAKILPIGTILFTSRAGIGSTAILSKEGTTNQGFQSIVPKYKILDSYFIFSRTNELKRYGEVTGAGSTFIEVSGKQMAKMSISIPRIEEQTKIGNFFKQLDETITLQERKLELLKELKKGYLQKMFV